MQEVHEKSLLQKLPHFSRSLFKLFKCIYSINRTLMMTDCDRFHCHQLKDVGSGSRGGIIRVLGKKTHNLNEHNLKHLLLDKMRLNQGGHVLMWIRATPEFLIINILQQQLIVTYMSSQSSNIIGFLLRVLPYVII